MKKMTIKEVGLIAELAGMEGECRGAFEVLKLVGKEFNQSGLMEMVAYHAETLKKIRETLLGSRRENKD